MKIPSPLQMSNTTLILSIGVASIALCAACYAHAQMEAPDTMQTQAVNSKALVAGALNKADKQFLIAAGQTGNTEVTASNIALKKAHSEDVKTFAKKMVDDHTKVGEQLKKLASDKGVKLPTELGKKNAAALAKILKLNGSTFDPVYTKSIGVDAHEDAVKLFKNASTKATDPDVKAFAVQTLPALEHHLQMAKDLNAKTK
jgi:putative membrane protein